MVNGFLILGYTVTPTHVGVGRSPGVVDLPVFRDPIGFPMIPASSVKGALKAYCALKNDCEIKDGRICCEKCPICCCFFGPEPVETDKGAGILSLTDFTLLAIPVPSYTHGWVYVTSPYLLRRVEGIAQAFSGGGSSSISAVIKGLLNSNPPAFVGELENKGRASRVTIPGETYEGINSINNGNLKNALNELGKVGPLANELGKRLLIVRDDEAVRAVNKGLMIAWRNRLNVDTKTVSGKALWSEEYIPPGTIFIGAVALTEKRNTYCDSYLKSQTAGRGTSINDAKDLIINQIKKEILGDSREAYLFIGGKETIGKGLLKLRFI